MSRQQVYPNSPDRRKNLFVRVIAFCRDRRSGENSVAIENTELDGGVSESATRSITIKVTSKSEKVKKRFSTYFFTFSFFTLKLSNLAAASRHRRRSSRFSCWSEGSW
jgi:hypothetical protein